MEGWQKHSQEHSRRRAERVHPVIRRDGRHKSMVQVRDKWEKKSNYKIVYRVIRVSFAWNEISQKAFERTVEGLP